MKCQNKNTYQAENQEKKIKNYVKKEIEYNILKIERKKINQAKQYYEKNKESVKKRKIEYYHENKEYKNEYYKQYWI